MSPPKQRQAPVVLPDIHIKDYYQYQSPFGLGDGGSSRPGTGSEGGGPPRKGTTFGTQAEPGITRVLGEEMGADRVHLQGEAKKAVKEVSKSLAKDIATAAASKPEAVAVNELLTSELQRSQTRTTEAYRFFRKSPLHQYSGALLREMNARGGFANRKSYLGTYELWRQSFEAATELAVIAERIARLTLRADQLASAAEQSLLGGAGTLVSITQRLQAIDDLVALHVRGTAPFLVEQLRAHEQILTRGPRLIRLEQDIEALARKYRSQVRTGLKADRRIPPPLTSPELQALKEFIDEQASRPRQTSYYRYHQSLLASESLKHLERVLKHARDLRMRAARLEQRQQELQATAVAFDGSLAASSAAIGVPGHIPLALAENIRQALVQAIRASVALLQGTLTVGAATVAATVVGVLALAWPSRLANSERRIATVIPLAAIDPAITNRQLEAAAESGGEVALPVTLGFVHEPTVVQWVATASDASTPSVTVLAARFDASRRVYSVATPQGPSLTWTPIAPPGTAHPPQTTFPAVPNQPDSYTGSLTLPPELTVTQIPGANIEAGEAMIVWFPAGSGIPPLLVVLSKPPVEPLEVGPYASTKSRSRMDGLDLDHIPSVGALLIALEQFKPGISKYQRKQIINQSTCIAIPSEIHRQFSETFGGRNSPSKQRADAADLKSAVDSNLDAIKPALIAQGFDEERIEMARAQLHQQNQQSGLYE